MAGPLEVTVNPMRRLTPGEEAEIAWMRQNGVLPATGPREGGLMQMLGGILSDPAGAASSAYNAVTSDPIGVARGLLVDPVVDTANWWSDAVQGRVPLTDAQGRTSTDAIGRAMDIAGGVTGLGAAGSTGRGAGNVVSMSGAKPPPNKKIAGAPQGVESPQKQAAIRKQYLKAMEDGTAARHWYDKAGASNLYHMGDDPVLAGKFTGGQAVTSASTAVDANLGHAIRAHNQKMAGDPARAGQYPTAMGERIDRIYGAQNQQEILDILGDKTGPYAENIARGGGYGTTGVNRAVHDIWDGRLWGYTDPNGKPFSGSFSPTQHRYMDEQMDMVVNEANRRSLGGANDWDHRSGQAAAWIARKAADEGKSIADAGRSYDDYMAKYYGQGSYEAAPGKTTTYMQGLLNEPYDVRKSHMDVVGDVLTDEAGRDRIAMAYGAPTGRTIEAPGVFEGDINPGRQTSVALGRATGGAEIDPSSAALMNAIEAQRGMLLGQDAAAWHLPGNPGEAVKRAGILGFETGGPISQAQMRDVIKRVKDEFGAQALDSVAPIGTPGGFRLLNFGVDNKQLDSLGKQIAKDMGINPPNRYAMIGGNLISNDWRVNPLGQEYIKYIDRPEFQAAFDKSAPQIASQLLKAEKGLVKTYGDGAGEITKLRKIIANEGYSGLMKAISTGAATVGAVGVILEMIGQPSASPGSASDGA